MLSRFQPLVRGSVEGRALASQTVFKEDQFPVMEEMQRANLTLRVKGSPT